MNQGHKLISLPTKEPVEARLSDRSDDELMLLSRSGADRAFEELVRRHQRRVLRVAAKYCGSAAVGADVAQNAFLELYRAVPGYRPRERFSSFLLQIVLNQCRMAQRSSTRRDRYVNELALEPTGDAGPPPDSLLLQAERRREVEAALSHLSPKLRDVVVLRFAADLSYQEIAETLDLPLGTVKSRLFAGLKDLHDLLRGEGR